MLTRNKYDARYFDARKSEYRHAAGYSQYIDGPQFEKRARWLVDNFQGITEGTFLDIGCAKGFLVSHLRKLGVDAYGLDWSRYAIDSASADISDYLFCGNALKYDQYHDYVYTSRFLCCFADPTEIIEHINSISRQQIHIIDTQCNQDWYNQKDIEWWAKQPFKPGTAIVEMHKENKIIWQY